MFATPNNPWLLTSSSLTDFDRRVAIYYIFVKIITALSIKSVSQNVSEIMGQVGTPREK